MEDRLSPQQHGNLVMAAANLATEEQREAAREIFTAAEYTDWQAFEVCKAFKLGLGHDAISAIANPELNHAQMRELVRAAKRFGSGSTEFQTLASHPEFPAKKLHDLCELMGWAGYRDIGFDPKWSSLDADSLFELTYAIVADVPADALSLYDSGEYPAESMACITDALTDGVDKPQIYRLLNPDYAPDQLRCIESAITDGLTDAQLDLLCDPGLPSPVMEAVRRGLLNGVPSDTVKGCIEARFTPRQMEVVFDAAVSEAITPEELVLIADRKLSPRQMLSLQISLEHGEDISQVEKEKLTMLRGKTPGIADGREPSRSPALRDAAQESRAASGELGGDRDAERDARKELE